MSEERPNAHMIFFPTELYMGLIKKMATLEIGKSAAILHGLNENLHDEGFIDDSTYEKFREQYRRKLVDVVKEKEQQKPTITYDPQKVRIQKTLVMVTEQWDVHDDKWREKWVLKAKQLKDTIPEAREILRKAGVLDE